MNNQVMVYENKPRDFQTTLAVASIQVHNNGKLLYLEYGSHGQKRGQWGNPAGKLEAGEAPFAGARRELFEETGIDIALTDSLKPFGELYIRYPDFDFVCHLYGVHIDTLPSIRLSSEHCSYRWISREEAENMPLIWGGKQVLDAYLKRSTKMMPV